MFMFSPMQQTHYMVVTTNLQLKYHLLLKLTSHVIMENYSYVYNHPIRGLPCSLLVKVSRACIVLHSLKTK